jgi:hypothetical protein
LEPSKLGTPEPGEHGKMVEVSKWTALGVVEELVDCLDVPHL